MYPPLLFRRSRSLNRRLQAALAPRVHLELRAALRRPRALFKSNNKPVPPAFAVAFFVRAVAGAGADRRRDGSGGALLGLNAIFVVWCRGGWEVIKGGARSSWLRWWRSYRRNGVGSGRRRKGGGGVDGRRPSSVVRPPCL